MDKLIATPQKTAMSAGDVISIVGTTISADGLWIRITIPKAVLVLSREQFIEGLRRGKSWRRHEALARRDAPEPQRP